MQDPTTGRPLFQPQTGRSPRLRNSTQLPIGDYLYAARTAREQARLSRSLAAAVLGGVDLARGCVRRRFCWCTWCMHTFLVCLRVSCCVHASCGVRLL